MQIPSIHKVRSPKLLSRRKAALQFCVMRSMAPSHSMGCDGVCASQEYDSALYAEFAARETSVSLHRNGSDSCVAASRWISLMDLDSTRGA